MHFNVDVEGHISLWAMQALSYIQYTDITIQYHYHITSYILVAE